MLVLSRKRGEKILIGDDIEITVNWIIGGNVSLSIDQPRYWGGTALVLTFQAASRIAIGDDIEIVINLIKGDKVSLGIEAPRDVRVMRSEIVDKEKRDEA